MESSGVGGGPSRIGSPVGFTFRLMGLGFLVGGGFVNCEHGLVMEVSGRLGVGFGHL